MNAIETAKAASDLAAQKTAAQAAVDELVQAIKMNEKRYENTKDAYDTLTAAITAATDTVDADGTPAANNIVNYYNNGALVDKNALVKALKDTLAEDQFNNADKDKENQDIDDSVTADDGIADGGADKKPNGMGYKEAYAEMGVTVDSTSTPITITLNKSDFRAILADPTDNQKDAILTMQQGSSNSLAAGVSLLAPEDTQIVHVKRTITYADGTTAEATFDWTKGTSTSVLHEDGTKLYMNLWFTLVTGTAINTDTGVVSNPTFAPNKTVVFEFTFEKAGEVQIGDTMTRTIVLDME